MRAQFQDGKASGNENTNLQKLILSLERGLTNACCFALQSDCINATHPQAYIFNKENVRMILHFSHKFVEICRASKHC